MVTLLAHPGPSASFYSRVKKLSAPGFVEATDRQSAILGDFEEYLAMNTLFCPQWSPARAVLRIGLDFSLGLALFILLLGLVSLGQSEAQAGAAGWVTKVVAEPQHNWFGVLSRYWQWVNRDSLHVLLALTFGVITAVNLALARHLRRVATSARPSLRP